MLGQSGVLTLLGMGVVFGFLAIMIVCVTLTGKIIHAVGADKDVIQRAVAAASPGAGPSNSGAITAAIAAAVAEYQKSNS
jgi:oxaloacetate decarboxylase gamma subunit